MRDQSVDIARVFPGESGRDRERLAKEGFSLAGLSLIERQSTEVAISEIEFHPPFVLVRIDGQELLRVVVVLGESSLRLRRVPALPGDVADPEDGLRVVENTLRILRIARQLFRGRGGRGLVRVQCRIEVAAKVVDLADEKLRPCSSAESIRVGLPEVAHVVIGEGALADAVEHVESPDRVEPCAQVGQHELDEPLRVLARCFGLVLCEAGGVSLAYGFEREACEQQDERPEACGERAQLA